MFKGVDQNLAVLMVILGGLLPATIDFFNVLNDAAALVLVRGGDFLSVFDKPQRDALAMLFLRLFRTASLRFGGIALASACRTICRCTPRFFATARIELAPCACSRLISSNSSTLRLLSIALPVCFADCVGRSIG